MKRLDVSLLRKQEFRQYTSSLDSRFRGNDTLEPSSLRSQPSSPVGGVAGCFIRLIRLYPPGQATTIYRG